MNAKEALKEMMDGKAVYGVDKFLYRLEKENKISKSGWRGGMLGISIDDFLSNYKDMKFFYKEPMPPAGKIVGKVVYDIGYTCVDRTILILELDSSLATTLWHEGDTIYLLKKES